MVVIRDASLKDLEALSLLYGPSYDGYERAKIFVECFLRYHHVKVVEANGEIIGVLCWYVREAPKYGLAEILELRVHPEHRRKGLGSILVGETLKDIARAFLNEGYKPRRVFLTAGEGNITARRLYEKLGFRLVGEAGDLYSDGRKELIYLYSFQNDA